MAPIAQMWQEGGTLVSRSGDNKDEWLVFPTDGIGRLTIRRAMAMSRIYVSVVAHLEKDDDSYLTFPLRDKLVEMRSS